MLVLQMQLVLHLLLPKIGGWNLQGTMITMISLQKLWRQTQDGLSPLILINQVLNPLIELFLRFKKKLPFAVANLHPRASKASNERRFLLASRTCLSFVTSLTSPSNICIRILPIPTAPRSTLFP